MDFKTEQEKFWAGDFGDEYVDRTHNEHFMDIKVAVWARMLRVTCDVKSIRELGCNVGANLRALKRLNPQFELSGYEINEKAATTAASFNVANIKRGTILEEIKEDKVDLVFTSGVLIHINPESLPAVYENLVNGSNRYVLVAEYYNSTPATVVYRGHSEKLFKRDFAGDLIENYSLKLVDYGFFYKRDKFLPQDDITWFLLEK